MKSFIASQFSYFPLIWMFHSRNLESRSNGIHQRALRLAYHDPQDLSFSDLLLKHKSISIHQKISKSSLQKHISKAKDFTRSNLWFFLFILKRYNLRYDSGLQRKTIFFVTESVFSLTPKLWTPLWETLKWETSVSISKDEISNWSTYQ